MTGNADVFNVFVMLLRRTFKMTSHFTVSERLREFPPSLGFKARFTATERNGTELH